MSNYLKIIFKCDLILQIFFLIILGGRGGPFLEGTAYKSKPMRKLFKKSNLIISVSYLMKRKFKKIFLEVISHTKIFYIKFCLMKLPTTKNFSKLTGE